MSALSYAPPAGISVITAPPEQTQVGRFSLPEDFDSRRFSASWVETTSVESYTRARQPIVGTQLAADPWSVWKNPKTSKPYKITVEKKEWILLCRPKHVSKAVNVIYGNLGKEAARNERDGQTVAGGELQDPGMLPEAVLRRVGISDSVTSSQEDPGGQFTPTPIAAATDGARQDGQHVTTGQET